MSMIVRFGALAVAAVAVSACSDSRSVFSFGQESPDEFAVVSRAPLAVPPDYSLQPPRPGAPRPQEGTASDRARAALVGAEGPLIAGTGSATGSAAENVLLARTGAASAGDDVRQRVDRLAGSVEGDENFVQRLLFWQGPESGAQVVDAEREAERLQGAINQGRPLNEGQVPSIERRDGGILSGLF